MVNVSRITRENRGSSLAACSRVACRIGSFGIYYDSLGCSLKGRLTGTLARVTVITIFNPLSACTALRNRTVENGSSDESLNERELCLSYGDSRG